jgi:hypothetical protein
MSDMSFPDIVSDMSGKNAIYPSHVRNYVSFTRRPTRASAKKCVSSQGAPGDLPGPGRPSFEGFLLGFSEKSATKTKENNRI